MSRTKIVGPWHTKSLRDRRILNADPRLQARMRRLRHGGLYWIEIWPPNTRVGDDVPRAPLPRVPALPKLIWAPSPNYSSRTTAISGIVIHETEGSYAGAVSWLRNRMSYVSAHVVLNEYGDRATQLVRWGDKAWHAGNANGHTIGIELAGYTSKPNDPAQLRAAARIVAYLCKRYDIPPVQATARGYKGICTHRSLGQWGGGHHDPGGFDWPDFLRTVAQELRRGNFPKEWGRP
jgi:N-acetyl-anhydromuramyl-L-alanine amidase AmpD